MVAGNFVNTLFSMSSSKFLHENSYNFLWIIVNSYASAMGQLIWWKGIFDGQTYMNSTEY